MTLARVYHSGILKSNSQVELTAEASNHLARVLRLKEKDPFIIFNGNGGEFHATIVAIQKKHLVADVGEYIDRSSESPLKIYLGQGISRGERMDFTVQKSVECGVFQITPVFTEYCNVQLNKERSEKRREHWQKIAISAAEQSGRTYIPEVTSPTSLENWLAQCNGLGLVCDPDSPPESTIDLPPNKSVWLLIGPEGGLSKNELELAKKAGFHAISLGPRILRTETAAVVAIALLQAQWGDM